MIYVIANNQRGSDCDVFLAEAPPSFERWFNDVLVPRMVAEGIVRPGLLLTAEHDTLRDAREVLSSDQLVRALVGGMSDPPKFFPQSDASSDGVREDAERKRVVAKAEAWLCGFRETARPGDADLVTPLLSELDRLRVEVERLSRPTWRCFHCDATFATNEEAAEHFGATDEWGLNKAACQLNVRDFRRMERELTRYRDEGSAVRALYDAQVSEEDVARVAVLVADHVKVAKQSGGSTRLPAAWDPAGLAEYEVLVREVASQLLSLLKSRIVESPLVEGAKLRKTGEGDYFVDVVTWRGGDGEVVSYDLYFGKDVERARRFERLLVASGDSNAREATSRPGAGRGKGD